MSSMLPVTADEIENKRQQLLAALAALPAAGIGLDKPLLRSLQENDESEWGDEEWDFANARELLTPQQKARYSVRLLARKQAEERDALLEQYQGGNIPGLGVATRDGVHSSDLMAGVVSVREGQQDEPPDGEEEPYENWKVAELKDEVRLRNEQRDDESKLAPASDRKEDLVTALETDDQNAS